MPTDRGLHTHLPTAIGEERVVTTSHGPFDKIGDMTIRMTALSMKPNACYRQRTHLLMVQERQRIHSSMIQDTEDRGPL